jgi:hypothetical protein
MLTLLKEEERKNQNASVRLRICKATNFIGNVLHFAPFE